LKDGKLIVVEEEAGRVGMIFRRPAEASRSVEGALSYFLRNRFFIGEVKYRGEILSGDQLVIIDKALFEAVQPYSINSSAICWRCNGTSTPRACAVLRLITSSNLIGVCTGRSAGFSPARIRAM
jgi:hypothetical protein